MTKTACIQSNTSNFKLNTKICSCRWLLRALLIYSHIQLTRIIKLKSSTLFTYIYCVLYSLTFLYYIHGLLLLVSLLCKYIYCKFKCSSSCCRSSCRNAKCQQFFSFFFIFENKKIFWNKWKNKKIQFCLLSSGKL